MAWGIHPTVLFRIQHVLIIAPQTLKIFYSAACFSTNTQLVTSSTPFSSLPNCGTDTIKSRHKGPLIIQKTVFVLLYGHHRPRHPKDTATTPKPVWRHRRSFYEKPYDVKWHPGSRRRIVGLATPCLALAVCSFSSPLGSLLFLEFSTRLGRGPVKNSLRLPAWPATIHPGRSSS